MNAARAQTDGLVCVVLLYKEKKGDELRCGNDILYLQHFRNGNDLKGFNALFKDKKITVPLSMR